MKNLISIAVAAATTTYAFTAQAEQFIEDNLLVTATRSEQSINNTLSSVSVLNESDIERLQPQDLVDLIGRINGVDVDHSGGRGSLSSVRLRGTESDHVLVLIDGVRANSASAGTTAFAQLPVSQIERVEIVRGPRSSLYGSDAIGGVIQIFTKKGAEGINPYVGLSYGSHDTRITRGGFRGQHGNTSFSLNASHEDTDGYDRTYNNSGSDTDDDGYRETALSANLQHTFNNDIELGFNYLRNESDSELDGGNNASESVNESRSLSLKAPLANNLSLHAQLARYRDQNTSFGFFPANFETTRDSASLELHFDAAEGQEIIVGYDYYNDDVNSTANFTEGERDNHSLFAQYLGKFDRWSLEAGLRSDDNEAFGSHETGNIALGFDLSANTLVSLSYGTGFKSPTFNDLYFPFTDFGCFFGMCFTFEGNPDLAPEESETLELMLRGNYDDFSWFASLYQTNIDNLIATNAFGTSVANIDETEILGGELGTTFSLLGWRTALSLAYTDPRNQKDDSLLLRRSRASANLDISKRFGKLDISAFWQVQSYRLDVDTDFDGKNDRLSGYGTVDLRASYQVSEALSLALKVDNIFDKEYRLIQPFETDGTSAAISVHYDF